jgi:hypothetical protein
MRVARSGRLKETATDCSFGRCANIKRAADRGAAQFRRGNFATNCNRVVDIFVIHVVIKTMMVARGVRIRIVRNLNYAFTRHWAPSHKPEQNSVFCNLMM